MTRDKSPNPYPGFATVPLARQDYTKHLGVYLDNRLNFSKHTKEAVIKAKKSIFSRKVLDMYYKLYVRPHLDYGEVIYHNQRADLMNLIEPVQYKAALIVSGCWQGTCRVKLYDLDGNLSLREDGLAE